LEEEDKALRALLGGISPKIFFLRHWEQRPLKIAGNESRYYEELLSTSKLDNILQFGSIKQPHFRVFKGGSALPPEYFSHSRTRGRDREGDATRVEEVYRELNEGASLAVQFLEYIDDNISDFCMSLSTSIGTRVQANSYLTLSNNQTLNPHYDMHDVFVLQIEGAKDWIVWDDPVHLAMRKPSNSQLRASSLRRVRNSPPLFQGTMYPGDVLYIPRGFVHVAKTSSEHSLHITFGLLVRRLHTLLKDAFDELLCELEGQSYMRKAALPERAAGEPLARLADHISENISDASLNAAVKRAISRAKGQAVD
jgi:lysine-specific demethylase/histidyl-hydroxylase NO66